VDCTLSGNYQIVADAICLTKNTAMVSSFKRLHLVKLVDYFSKIDETKICKLKIIVRKMLEHHPESQIHGTPQEIQQSMLNCQKLSTSPPEPDKTKKKERG
jgi:hypothetical protein